MDKLLMDAFSEILFPSVTVGDLCYPQLSCAYYQLQIPVSYSIFLCSANAYIIWY